MRAKLGATLAEIERFASGQRVVAAVSLHCSSEPKQPRNVIGMLSPTPRLGIPDRIAHTDAERLGFSCLRNRLTAVTVRALARRRTPARGIR